jgi:hypothetical protein
MENKKLIINENQYNFLINEMAYPTWFNMDEFKKLTSFAQRVKYCNEKLQRISSGSARIVYKIYDEKVLKLAKNRKGIAQNEVEAGDYYLRQIGCFANIYDFDDNYLWIEMQLARKVKKSDFKRLTGYDFDTMCAWIRYNANRYNRYINCSPEYQKFFESEEWLNFIEDNYDSIFYQISDYLGNYQVNSIGDLMRFSSWGVVKEDGEEKLCIIDFGLNDDVYDNYYKPKKW